MLCLQIDKLHQIKSKLTIYFRNYGHQLRGNNLLWDVKAGNVIVAAFSLLTVLFIQ